MKERRGYDGSGNTGEVNMASNGNQYREKNRVWLNILYYTIVFFLILSMIVMYSGWKKRRAQYSILVQEAAYQDQDFEIELRKLKDVPETEDGLDESTDN